MYLFLYIRCVFCGTFLNSPCCCGSIYAIETKNKTYLSVVTLIDASYFFGRIETLSTSEVDYVMNLGLFTLVSIVPPLTSLFLMS